MQRLRSSPLAHTGQPACLSRPEASQDSVATVKLHYEAIIRDLAMELRSKDNEIGRLREVVRRGKWEEEGLTPEGSTRAATREDCVRTGWEAESEKMRTQLTESMEMLATYREKYYKSLQQIATLEEQLARLQAEAKPAKSPRRSPTFDHSHGSKKAYRVIHSANSSGITYLVPEPEVTSPSPMGFTPSPIPRKGWKPKTRHEARSYIPSHLRFKRPGSGHLREEQTEPYTQQAEFSRPDSRFADEFPEENELE